MRRWIPLLMIVAGLVVLGAYFGPDLYRGMLFKRDCASLLEGAAAGDLAKVVAQLAPAQQGGIGTLITSKVPDGYHEQIESLKLTRWWRADTTTIWSVVTLRYEQGEGLGLYQGKLRWVYDPAARRWWWDFGGSYAAPYNPSGEPEWQRIGELLPKAEQL